METKQQTKEKLWVKIGLEGKDLEDFNQLRDKWGITAATEVLRHALTEIYKQELEAA